MGLFRRKKSQSIGWTDLAKKHGIKPTKEMEKADRELREIEQAEKASKKKGQSRK